MTFFSVFVTEIVMTQDCEELIIHVLAVGGLGVGHMLRRPLFPTPVTRKKMCNRRENIGLAPGAGGRGPRVRGSFTDRPLPRGPSTGEALVPGGPGLLCGRDRGVPIPESFNLSGKEAVGRVRGLGWAAG